MPSLGFVDTGLTPGQTYSYRIVVRDSDNHVVNGATGDRHDAGARSPTNAYANQVRADGARLYWPLSDSARPGRRASRPRLDRAGVSDGRADNGVTWGQTGAHHRRHRGPPPTDNESSRIFAVGAETAPDTFTAQVWVNTDNAPTTAAASSASATCRPEAPGTATGTST